MKSLLKKHTATGLVALMVLSNGVAFADQSQISVTSAQVTSQVTNSLFEKVVVNGVQMVNSAFVGEAGQLMVPLREISEQLGFKVTWDREKQWAEVSKEGTPIWTLVQPELNQYTYNRMNVTLEAAPVTMSGKTFVPASFFNEILRVNVNFEGNQVLITSASEEIEMQTQQGVITRINQDEQYKSIQINGIELDGLILNIDEDTMIRNAAGDEITLDQLAVGMSIDIKHSLAITLSLPGQTYAYEITVTDQAEDLEILGTAGHVTEVREDEAGNKSITVQGKAINEGAQEHIILQLNQETIVVDTNGNAIEPATIKKDDQVLAFYGPKLTRSLPPIGQAWKIVVIGQ